MCLWQDCKSLIENIVDIPEDDKETIKDLERQLEEAKLNNRLTAEERDISLQKDDKIKILENQLKAQEMKYVNELKAKNMTITQLKTELERKAGTVAELANKLRAMHKDMASRKAEQEMSLSREDSFHKYPTPPREERGPHQRRSSAGRRSSKVVLNQEVVPRPPSSRRLSTSDSIESVPDPAPFLNRRLSQDQPMRRSSATPLPPIGLRESTLENPIAPLPSKYSRKEKSKGSHASPSSEVQVLAVDSVSKKHQSLSRQQQYQRDSQGT